MELPINVFIESFVADLFYVDGVSDLLLSILLLFGIRHLRDINVFHRHGVREILGVLPILISHRTNHGIQRRIARCKGFWFFTTDRMRSLCSLCSSKKSNDSE
jgi:hypothetical protein